MEQELNENELENVTGGATFDDGKRYNIHCTNGKGDEKNTNGVKGTEAKDRILANKQKLGYTCTVQIVA